MPCARRSGSVTRGSRHSETRSRWCRDPDLHAVSPSGYPVAVVNPGLPPRPRGISALLPRHRTVTLLSAGATAFALLCGGAVFAGASAPSAPSAPSVSAGQPAGATRKMSTADPAAPAPPPRPTPESETPASSVRTCSVTEAATDPRLATFQAQVVNANTGEVLFDRDGITASRTASVLKVLTAAAALTVLGPDYRATTTVVRGTEPGEVVLVGGGDVTLSRTPSGEESVYAGAPHLDALAAQARAAWNADPANDGVPIRRLVLDSSLFGGPGWESSWERAELGGGYMPEITALQVDGDRDDPYSRTSARSTDPIARAGAAFVDALGGDVEVTRGTAPADAAQLAAVHSQPVSILIQQALIVSDNALAEMLARLVAVRAGAGNTFAALQGAVVGGLQPYGLDTSGIVIADGSGLSPDNAVPPSYLTRLLVKVNIREGNLGAVFDGLPVAGRTGSLSYSDRFAGDNSAADGAVFAKTGWIDTGYTLAGIIHAADGVPLTFALYALGNVSDNAKQALDTLTTAFYRCGGNLSNN